MDSPTADDDVSPISSKRASSRRQFAFYPNMNSSNKPTKPFSRSAAKRESVMALGSIEHLQHYFTKTGLAAEKNPVDKPNNGMIPAIGGLNANTSRKWPEGVPEFQLPPSPIVPQIVRPTSSPYVKTYEIDHENLRPSIIEDLTLVEHAWWLNGVLQSDMLSVQSAHTDGNSGRVDVLDLLRTTTHAVRSVRNYLLSLPDDGPTPVKRDFHFRPPMMTMSSAPLPRRQASQPDSSADPLSRIRRSALEVLTVLRIVEEASRLPLSDDAYDAQSDHGESTSGSSGSHAGSGSASGFGSGPGRSVSRATSPDFLGGDAETPVSISYLHVPHRDGPVPVWEDDDDIDLNAMTEEEKRDRWDERLVLGSGWLYRQDVKRDELTKERDVVARYLDAVDETLFTGRKDGKRGWEREREKEERRERERVKSRRASAGDPELREKKRDNRRIVSTGMLDVLKGLTLSDEPEGADRLSGAESVDDEDLPEWAKRGAFTDDDLGRLYALLQALIPSPLQHLLPPPPADRALLLNALSSGQLLCIAYNTGVRRSRKPWGYVNKDAIHDIAALEAQSVAEQEQEKTRGWTFRRTDNLRLWAAALKLRYSIPVWMPPSAATNKLSPAATPLSSPLSPMFRFPAVEPPVTFDVPLIARKEPGWEDMLETLALRWTQAVVDEKRGSDGLRVYA